MFSFNLDNKRHRSLFANENSTTEANSPINRTLINLIKFFGGVDVLLICSYSICFAIDRRRHKGTSEIGNRMITVPEHNSMYENIEIIFSPNG